MYVDELANNRANVNRRQDDDLEVLHGWDEKGTEAAEPEFLRNFDEPDEVDKQNPSPLINEQTNNRANENRRQDDNVEVLRGWDEKGTGAAEPEFLGNYDEPDEVTKKKLAPLVDSLRKKLLNIDLIDVIMTLMRKDSPSPELKPDAAFTDVVTELANREDSHRKSQAALLKPALDTYLRKTPATDFATKSTIVTTINDVLARFDLMLMTDGQPCRLKVERKDDTDRAGFWLLESRHGKNRSLGQGAEATELPSLDVISTPALGSWQAREDARLDPFTPLSATTRMAKEELAIQILEPLKERLRGMPHESYEDKKQISKWVNRELRNGGLAIRCPKSKQPSILIAGKKGKERSSFFLSHHEGDKDVRSFSTEKIEKLIKALQLMPTDPMKGTWGRNLIEQARSATPGAGLM